MEFVYTHWEFKGAFSLHSDVWSASDRTLETDVLPPKMEWNTPNRSVGRVIPDYFEANQWGWTRVSGNDNHSLLITSKES